MATVMPDSAFDATFAYIFLGITMLASFSAVLYCIMLTVMYNPNRDDVVEPQHVRVIQDVFTILGLLSVAGCSMAAFALVLVTSG